jgi:hypothetical protein
MYSDTAGCDKIFLTYKILFRTVNQRGRNILSITRKEERDEGPSKEGKDKGEVKPA